MSYERKSVWIIEQYSGGNESEAISAWTTQALAVQAAEGFLADDSNVEKQLDHPDHLHCWRSDQRQVFVRELLVLDTWGYEPHFKKALDASTKR